MSENKNQLLPFYINNKKIFSTQNLTIQNLLNFLNLNSNLIVIEYNKIILPKSLWQGTVIKTGDKIEFVTIVGGG